VPYTLWSLGRLLGGSELDYARVPSRLFKRHRMGDFCPTDVGLKVMPVATGVSPAGIALAKMLRASSERSQASEPQRRLIPETLRQTSEWADFVAAQDRCDALALELRGPDGAVIPTEWIDLRDTESLLSPAWEDDWDVDDAMAGFADDVDECEGVLSSDYETPDKVVSPLDSLGLDEFDVAIEEENEWRAHDEFPRYQLQVMLCDAASVP
jgi:hypothetical protein